VPLTRGDRALRAGVFALVATLLAVGAHWLGSAMVPRGPVIAIAAVALAGIGWVLSARPRGMTVLIITTVVSQFALHTAFAASMARDGMPAMSLILCGHDQGASTALTATPHLDVVHHGGSAMTSDVTGHGLLMLAAHIAAAALVGLWLRLGERVLVQLGALLVALRRALLRVFGWLLPATAGPARCRAAAPVSTRLQPGTRVIGALGLRGPPSLQPC
jgi:hypothetical protein